MKQVDEECSTLPVKIVLLVEDEFIIRLMVADGLREEGFEVVEAVNGDEAVDLIRAGAAIDVVFSDVRMPGATDGLALLAFVRDTFAEMPVIITSGHLPQLPCADGNATWFLPKPYRIDQVRHLIDTAFDEAR